jgi:uncharacterized phage-associated protein
LILKRARADGVSLSHLALQKLLYFAHGQYLLKEKQPLCDGFFEAWKDGPVHPVVYAAFKRWGSSPILEDARGEDFVARREVALPPPNDPRAEAIVAHLMVTAGRLSASVLRNISHAPNGPWAFVSGQIAAENKAGTKRVLGPRIPDRVTKERFRHLMVPVSGSDDAGDPVDDSPLT